MRPFDVTPGTSPVVLSMPHTGTDLPHDVAERLNETGRGLSDTDWHIDQLFDGLLAEATVIRANFHRYAIDANRDPQGHSLYPGQATTDLIPLTDFDGVPIWRSGSEPDDATRTALLTELHQPYHAAIAGELERVHARHGMAILFDCHSIRSVVPRLFDGVLPTLNIGDNDHTTCARWIHDTVADAAAESPYTWVANGRFKGGWTTRHHGRPETGVHAIQLEIAQSSYLVDEAPPWRYDSGKADALRRVLAAMLSGLHARAMSGTSSDLEKKS